MSRIPKTYKPLSSTIPTKRVRTDWLNESALVQLGRVEYDKANIKMLMDNMRLAKSEGFTRFDFVSDIAITYSFWNKVHKINKKGKYKLRIKYGDYDKQLWTFLWDETEREK